MSDDNRLYLFDTTLRDGQQTGGVDFNVADKAAIPRALDEIDIGYIEGGWPGANPTDNRFFAAPLELTQVKLVAFGVTRRPGRSTENDPGLAEVLAAKAQAVCLVGKAWGFHVDVALEIERDAITRLMIESGDDEGTWTTIGASANMIGTSINALSDGLAYKLMKDGVSAVEA
jgi:2-isopropylmalate synthase